MIKLIFWIHFYQGVGILDANLFAEHLYGKEDSHARTIVHQLLKDRSLKVI